MFDIDPKTGFYNGGSSLVTIVNILLFVVTVLLMTPLIIKSYKKLEAAPRRCITIGVISAVVALAFCFSAVFLLIDATNVLNMLKSGSTSINLNSVFEYDAVDITPNTASTIALSMFFNSVFEFAAVAFFLLFSRASFKGGRIAFPIASLLPVIWATVYLMAAFMHYTTVVNISEYLFDMLKMVFVMIFFYYHARFTGRVTNGNELKGMLAFGLPAVFFSLVSILPRYIAMTFGKTVTFDLPEDLLFVVLSVYIAAVIFVAFFTHSRDTVGTELIDGKSLEAEDTQAGGE
jgi:hypothetical protein